MNLYGMLSNDAIHQIDKDGRIAAPVIIAGVAVVATIAASVKFAGDAFDVHNDAVEMSQNKPADATKLMDAFEDGTEAQAIDQYNDHEAQRHATNVENVADIADKMPSSSMTGPMNGMPDLKPMLNDVMKATSTMAKCCSRGQFNKAARNFGHLNDAMKKAGYNHVGGASGGFYRRPPGNPKNLPDPVDVNKAVKELWKKINDSCGH